MRGHICCLVDEKIEEGSTGFTLASTKVVNSAVLFCSQGPRLGQWEGFITFYTGRYRKDLNFALS
jgi:hypothetical protein